MLFTVQSGNKIIRGKARIHIVRVPDTICADHFLVRSPSWLAGGLQIQPETQEGTERRKGWQHQVGSDSTAPLEEQKQKHNGNTI